MSIKKEKRKISNDKDFAINQNNQHQNNQHENIQYETFKEYIKCQITK